ncbi:MAG: hypothetical protein QMC62_13870 [Alteromonadaceae bacterium]|jgi:hypothetical protein|tara:strand:+ start:726 stop:1082 length:357 start_codon:yes stop_codon:yes gene_type:complete
MKNLLILIVAAALFLHFYPQPELEDWFSEKKVAAITIFSKATDTQARLKADKIYSDLESQFNTFSTDEQAFLKKITMDRESVQAFFTDFCQSNKQTPQLHNENQQKVCQTIAHYSLLL